MGKQGKVSGVTVDTSKIKSANLGSGDTNFFSGAKDTTKIIDEKSLRDFGSIIGFESHDNLMNHLEGIFKSGAFAGMASLPSIQQTFFKHGVKCDLTKNALKVQVPNVASLQKSSIDSTKMKR